ncbi:MAG: ribosomal protein S18-alanine N-acetyltransferase [Candidatus Poribacteria bacterium]|nr:ribosomal protein S18-alanine N-acetyltransferase [Candidatus Poribacteria bacterium]
MSACELRFGAARPGDIDEMRRIERQSFASPWPRAFFEKELSGELPQSRTTAAWLNGKLAAYCIAWTAADETHIVNFAVHPNLRRQGIGKALVRNLFAEARRSKAPRVTLEVRVSNLPAIRLYESMGFQIVAVRKGYYLDNGENAYIMWADARHESTSTESVNDESQRSPMGAHVPR